MSVETVEAFAERATATMTDRDREGYFALFDLPCAVWGDQGVDLRLNLARLEEVWEGIAAQLDLLDRPRHRYRIDAQRLLGERLTVLRVLTWLDLSDGTRSDPTSELWILRETDGRLGLIGLVNPMSMHVLDPRSRPPEPDLATAGPGGPATAEAFLVAMHEMIRDKDIEANERLISLPYLRFTDELTGMIRTRAERRAMAEAAHREIGPRAAATARTELLAERPYGRTLTCLRIRFHGVRPDGGDFDPREELWILRDAGKGLQVCGVVNPATSKIMKTEDHFDYGDDLQ
ncbi:MAG: hypothetical protein AAF192_11150 [Pseudomonadota bacterium]